VKIKPYKEEQLIGINGFYQKPILYKINHNKCWICLTGLNSNGYPMKWYRGKMRKVSRIIYEKYNTTIPDGLHVLHSCDNRACINPKHLWLGKHTDNMRDKIKKERGNPCVGEKNGSAKLSLKQVYEIIEAKATQIEISKKYNISQYIVWAIKNKKIWKCAI
jgi:hypothetical protein